MKTINVNFILNTNLALSADQGTLISNYVQQFYPENTVVEIDLSHLYATSTQFLKHLFEPLNDLNLAYQVHTNDRQAHLKAKIAWISDGQTLSQASQDQLIFS